MGDLLNGTQMNQEISNNKERMRTSDSQYVLPKCSPYNIQKPQQRVTVLFRWVCCVGEKLDVEGGIPVTSDSPWVVVH